MQQLSANEVANFILANQKENTITNRKLQKLLYYCQAFYLKEEGTTLFSDKIEAWEFGPVCSNVYHTWKEYRYRPLPKISVDANNYSEKAKKVIFLVIAIFGIYTHDELIEMSHIDAPWASQYIKDENRELKPDMLNEYFSNFNELDDYKLYVKEKLKYSSLISDRKSYLKNLINLGDDWISPKSFAPNITSIKASSIVLSLSSQILNKDVSKKVPKLILSPIPSGGIGIEFISTLNNKLFVNIYNDKSVEIDIEKNKYFEEYELDTTTIKEKFQELYMEFA